jgi:hypothetical protein
MQPVTQEDAVLNLAKMVLVQAIHDYNGMVANGSIVDGKVNEDKWFRYGSSTGCHRPMNMGLEEALSLVQFLMCEGLDYYCSMIGHHACRIRAKLKISKEG